MAPPSDAAERGGERRGERVVAADSPVDVSGIFGADAQQVGEVHLEVRVGQIEDLCEHDHVVMSHLDAGTDRSPAYFGDQRQVAAQHGFVARCRIRYHRRLVADGQSQRVTVKHDWLTR